MIIGFTGTRGRGKTLSAVKELYDYAKAGYSIYSNIKLNKMYFKNYDTYTLKELLAYASGDKQFRKTVFLMDEVQVYIDSRMSASKKNVLVSYFIMQTRKRDVRLIWTSQFPHQVDKRLRDPTELWVRCQNFKKGEVITQRNLIIRVETGQTFSQEFEANKYFEYYDTNEIVNPFK